MQINIDTHADAHLLEVTAAFLFTISNAALRASVTGGATPPAADVAAPVDETPAPSQAPAATVEAPARRTRRSKAEIEAEAAAKVQEAPAPEAATVQEPAAEAPVTEAAPAAAAPAPVAPTKEDVQRKLGELLSAKGMPACKALLESYNVAGIGALKPEQYAEFLADIGKAMEAA